MSHKSFLQFVRESTEPKRWVYGDLTDGKLVPKQEFSMIINGLKEPDKTVKTGIPSSTYGSPVLWIFYSSDATIIRPQVDKKRGMQYSSQPYGYDGKQSDKNVIDWYVQKFYPYLHTIKTTKKEPPRVDFIKPDIKKLAQATSPTEIKTGAKRDLHEGPVADSLFIYRIDKKKLTVVYPKGLSDDYWYGLKGTEWTDSEIKDWYLQQISYKG